MVRAVGLFWIVVCSLDAGSVSDLSSGTLGMSGLGGSILLALRLLYHKGSGGRSSGLDEDQVALVIPDSTCFGSEVPVTLGTPTINQIINMIKESKIDELLVSLSGLRMAKLLVGW